MSNSKALTPSSPATFARHVSAPAGDNRDLSIGDLLMVFKRRKSVVLKTILALFVCGVLICLFSTPRYQAKAQIVINKDSNNSWTLGANSGGESSDALDENITIQTQSEVLKSEELALRVIKELDLEHDPDFKPTFNPVGWVLGLISPKGGAPDGQDLPLEQRPYRRTSVLKTFAKNLKVKAVSGTRLVDVSYLNPNPKVAAAVVNHMAQALMDYNFETRFNATQQASTWLGGQLSDLRKKSEDLQSKVVSLRRDSGVFTMGETDAQGRQESYTPVLDRLQQATTQLSQAETNRIMKGAVYEAVKSGNADLISGLAGNGLGSGNSPGLQNSLALMQNLRGQEATAQANLDQLSAKFGPGYPKLSEARANLKGIQASIQEESGRIAQRARNDYEVAKNVETDARMVWQREKAQAETLNNKTIEYTMAKQEADQSRTLYEGLLGKLQEAGVLAGLRSSNISLVDPARAPARPTKPNVLLVLAGSLAGGLFLGSCLALATDSSDNKIQDLPRLHQTLGDFLVGVLPYHPQKERGVLTHSTADRALLPANGSVRSLAAAIDSRSAYVEALRGLRTSIVSPRYGQSPQVILVTSSVAGEGKSMLSSNLAVLMAQQGKKTLLVDGDLRNPVLHRRFNIDAQEGLSTLLGQETADAYSAVVPIREVPGLHVLPAGPTPLNPAELLASEQMAQVAERWRKEYQFIIIDGVPVLPVTDSVLLSNYADLTLVLARYKMTERQSLERSCSILESQGNRQIRIVLNGVQPKDSTYQQYYGYKDSKLYGKAQHA